jgi:crossover junction endodeoxyribonuclease RuvC
VRILGIDPGSRYTGYGIIDKKGQSNHYVTSGRVNAAKGDGFAERLDIIHGAVTEILSRFEPTVCAMESLFVAKNAMSSLKLGHARGVSLLAINHEQLRLHEYAPTQVKNTIAGHGRADKDAVKEMVKRRLDIEGRMTNDASDALAIALCHAHTPSFEKAT